jgi:hypothetical protein
MLSALTAKHDVYRERLNIEVSGIAGSVLNSYCMAFDKTYLNFLYLKNDRIFYIIAFLLSVLSPT